MPGIKILIVDDVLENRMLLSSIIRKNTDYNTFLAEDGFQALNLIAENESEPFDIIILDIMMPEMDGFQVALKIKENPKYDHIPIIFNTALTDRDNIVKAFEMGGVDYITKPFNKGELLARIDVHIKLKIARDELCEKNNELKELNELKNKYIGILAHDLRNPISAIMMTSEFLMMRMKSISEKEKNFLKQIHNSSTYMHHLVNDLLDISAIESGKLKLKKQIVNIEEIILENIRLNNIIADKKNIFIHYESSVLNPNLKADEIKLEQVFSNLITNAVKFSPADSNINIKIHDDTDHIYVQIEDFGVGMDEDMSKNLFDVFNQRSQRGTQGEKGTGLGLAIVKKIMDAHQGQISVISKLGKGTEFTLKFLRS